MKNVEQKMNQIIDRVAMKKVSQISVIISLIYMFLFSSAFALDRKESKNLSRNIKREYIEVEKRSTAFDVESNLEDYLAYAALNNPGLKADFYNWQATLEKEGIVDALPDPKVSFGYYIENVETRVGPQNQKIGIRQTIPWFGVLGAKGDIAFAASNIAYRKFQKSELELFYKVKKSFYDYWLLGREIQLTSENMELLKFWESVVRTKYKVAQQKHHNVIKAQVELGKLDDNLKTLESMIRPVSARLRSALNLPDSIQLPIPTTITEEETVADREKIIAKVLDYNPSLKSIEHLIEKEKAGVRLANKSWLPNFTFGLDYIETGEALNSSMDESGKDPLIVSFSVNVPLWIGKNRSKQDAARARYKSAQYKLDDTQNRLVEMTEKLIFEYDDAIRKIRLYRDGLVPKAEESLNATFAAYQAGNTDFLNVLYTPSQLLKFQLMLDRAKRNQANKKAELEVITGENLINHN